ncbi:MAG: ribonucleoside-diphosphate reductase subunit alpha [Solobacterium sp.]|nr:ribonucleoside-diphosphate reductase subunit alpha [Solobacterium sp.]
MEIIKRNGSKQNYHISKIENAVKKAFIATQTPVDEKKIHEVAKEVEKQISKKESVTVEEIQDLVEEGLMKHGYFAVAKSYILYREKRSQIRATLDKIINTFQKKNDIRKALEKIEKDFQQELYPVDKLADKFFSFVKEGQADSDLLPQLIRAAVELTSQEAPNWEFIAARILLVKFQREVALYDKTSSFYEKVKSLVKEGLYGEFITKEYTKKELEEASTFIDSKRDYLFNYSGLELLIKRYLIVDHAHHPLETPQEMYLGIALHLAINEKKNRMKWVKKFYDMLSTMKVTMATPTLSNARKPFHQLSSCFIDTVPDSLDGIYRSIDNFAKVSKLGGGMGLYFGKVRAKGSTIRGFEGAAGGVIRWIRLANDTAVAVDQLGVRQGACAVYLDVWHKDLPEFLAIRTNNGDDRLKAHDVFPAVCYPDYFWQQARDNISGDWYLLDPHEVKEVKGYCLEDSYGEEWTKKYLDCVNDPKISKRTLPIKEVIRLVIKSAVETGTPFVFNRDIVNKMNPNGDKGMIYCSNLCTEIAQNMSEISLESQEIVEVNGEKVVVTTTKPGDFVVCNLASLTLGRLDVDNDKEMKEIIHSVVRALDNVIDINLFPLPYAQINNGRYRPIGLGVSGYHHMLTKHGIPWESEKHLEFADKVFEKINYYAIEASMELAKEKGKYSLFKGSDWDTGTYFTKRNYTSKKWKDLQTNVHKHGLRNGYLIAIAPTSSTSIISGTTAGLDPIMNRYFLEEKKDGLIPRLAPELSVDTYFLYKNAHYIDQTWSVKANGIRQRHVDQAMSMNLYITNDYTFRKILNLYLLAWECGVKTLYYVRSKSLEVEECEACSA